jgi:DnaJ-class molecular chaperone
MLSTATNPVVCTYCNGTGKGGHWNDETLKVGDDCPWCVLGYDELGKGPCRHCMGTGRYLGLDKLGFINVSEKKEKRPGKTKK